MSACEQERSSNPSSVTFQEIESVREESKHVFKWTLREFKCETAKVGENVPATKFEFKLGENMIFDCKLSICGVNCCKRQLGIELKSQTHENWSVGFNICFNENERYDKYHVFTQDSTSQKSKLFYKDCLLTNRLINTITCEIVHVAYKEIIQPTPYEIEESSLKSDLGNLFNNKMFCDVTFEVGEEKIKAHKCILISRCNALASIIKLHELVRSESEHIIVEGIEPKVFNEMLRYIYTDKVPKFNQMTSRLLVASEKYGLDRLKAICENELANTFTVETVSDLLILADNNNAKRLKERAIAYIKNRSVVVANTTGWQNIVKDHLHLLAELHAQVIH